MSEQDQTDQPGPPPAANVGEATQQAQAIRARIDQDLRALEARLPPPETLQAQAKTYGGAAAAGVATLGALALTWRRRSAAKAQDKEVRRQAEALARALPDAALRVHNEQVDISGKAGRLGLLVALAALGVALWARFGSRGAADDWGGSH